MLRLFLHLLPIFMIAPVSGADERDTPNLAPIEKWLEFHRSTRSVEADFVQFRELRTLRNPLRSEGKVWIDYQGERFRWQAGLSEDPKVVAVKKDKALTVLQPSRKLAQRIDMNEAAREMGPSAAFDLATGDLPDTLPDLQKAFTVLDVKGEAGAWRARLQPKDGHLRDALDEVVFVIDGKRHFLRGFELTFRDRSKVKTTFTKQQFNTTFDDALFNPDLTGYEFKD